MAYQNEQVGSICTYRIDADDRIVSVGDNWEAFVAENDAPDACFAPTSSDPASGTTSMIPKPTISIRRWWPKCGERFSP